jgi:two-component system, NarL family, nitrate/nitrite response regulator NarL
MQKPQGGHMEKCVSIAIYGKNELVREGLGRILAEEGFRIGASRADLDEIIGRVAEFEVVLIDDHSFAAGLAACMKLRSETSAVKIVLMVDTFAPEEVAEAFRTGVVDGYVLKDIACRPLAGTLRLIALGEKVFPAQVVKSLPIGMHRNGVASRTAALENLSTREVDILGCLVNGDANKLISRRLNISDATVKVHIKAILRKLGVANRTQAAIWAVNRGLSGGAEEPQPGWRELAG